MRRTLGTPCSRHARRDVVRHFPDAGVLLRDPVVQGPPCASSRRRLEGIEEDFGTQWTRYARFMRTRNPCVQKPPRCADKILTVAARPFRGAPVPRSAHGGHRRGRGPRQGHPVPIFQGQGRPLPGLAQRRGCRDTAAADAVEGRPRHRHMIHGQEAGSNGRQHSRLLQCKSLSIERVA